MAIEVRNGWDAELSELEGPQERTLAHVANFALPNDRGDYGSGAVDEMDAAGIFISLMEFNVELASTALFKNSSFPTTLTECDFSTKALQRRMSGQLGLQRFFTSSGRPFVLYVVLGSSRLMALLVAEVNRTLAGITIKQRT